MRESRARPDSAGTGRALVVGVACGRRAGPLTFPTNQTVRVSERGGRHDRDFRQPLVDRARERLRPVVGAGAVMVFTFGVFLKPVTEDLGVSRGDLSSALGVSTWFVAASCPVIGWLIDRFGTRRVMIPGILLFALAVASSA